MGNVNIGIIGCGTVGFNVVKILETHADVIRKKAGCGISIRKVCDKNTEMLNRLGLPQEALTSDYNDILSDDSIDIVVELIGGVNAAGDILRRAIAGRKHVVTANKALLANNWSEVFSLAAEKNIRIYFEAAVGAGIPVIKALNEGLAGNKIVSIVGILNGTTNFILTKMSDAGMNFDDALKNAQKLGFAEADPSLDIDGSDAAQKLSILGSIALGNHVKVENIYKEGIAGVTPFDIKYARDKFGYVLKLLAIIKNEDDTVSAAVYPAFISYEHPLAFVDNEYNAVYVQGDFVDDIMLYGKGAGGGSAASAVVSDIIYLARDIYYGTAGKFPHILYDKKIKLKTKKIEDKESKYYLRFSTVDRPGVLSKIAGILGKNKVSISACFQEERHKKHAVPILILTHMAREGNVRKAVKEIDMLDIVKSRTIVIHIAD
jgi:homoserine dehydrogenase